MSSGGDPDWLGEPSDDALTASIRRARGLPPDAPVAAHVLREVRVWSRGEARTWLRARRLRLPVPVPHASRSADAAVREVISDLMSGPEMACLMYLIAALPDVAAAVADGIVAILSAPARHAAAPIRAYAAGKLGLPPWPARRGSVGRRAYIGGRVVPCRTPAELGPHPLHVAACNAASPQQVGEWVAALEGWDASVSRTLDAMEAVGWAACTAVPLPLWQPELGPPRGVWPPAPPVPAESPAPSGDRAAGPGLSR